MNLILQSLRGHAPVSCDLHTANVGLSMLDAIDQITGASKFVYSDVPYVAKIYWGETIIPPVINIYMNGEIIEYSIAEIADQYTMIKFTSESNQLGNIFRDCYGYVQIAIECAWGQDNNLEFYTDYIGVMLRSSKTNDALQKMAEYVYKMHQHFMWKRNMLPSGLVQLSQSEEKSLDAQVELIKLVIRVFEHNISFFKTNPYTKADYSYQIADYSKLRQITHKTSQYIAQHPDELAPADIFTGIVYQHQDYYPRKTLVLNTEQRRNNYENRAILGFLHSVVITVADISKRISNYLQIQQDTSPTVDGYISSTVFILQTSRHRLENKHMEIMRLQSLLHDLYLTYKSFFPIDDTPLVNIPDATAVFRTSSQYRQIYDVMVKWFAFGCYDFSGEYFLLPLLVNHQLYEYYVLYKLAASIEAQDFQYITNESSNFKYPVRFSKYKAVEHLNTFVFRSSYNATITLYFQPVIWGQQYSNTVRNGISLRRTTTLSIDHSNRSSNAFYTPDYILKYQSNDVERYIIADAKLQSYSSVWSRQIENLAFKYQFSIKPSTKASNLVGVMVFYGKSVDIPGKLSQVHDIYTDNNPPLFWTTSLTERESCSSTSQTEMLKDALRWLCGQDEN